MQIALEISISRALANIRIYSIIDLKGHRQRKQRVLNLYKNCPKMPITTKAIRDTDRIIVLGNDNIQYFSDIVTYF